MHGSNLMRKNYHSIIRVGRITHINQRKEQGEDSQESSKNFMIIKQHFINHNFHNIIKLLYVEKKKTPEKQIM